MDTDLPTDTVTISGGKVRGQCSGTIRTFLGVPYANPPQRFELPEPRTPWQDVFDATDPGPSAPHRIRPFPAINVAPLVGTGSDGSDGDYLRLNIWAPREAENAPVMVWVHGGGFVVGSKDAAISDGSAFAKSGVICIAINYRMGIDGFLPVPGAPTNLGLRDILFALQWVQDNVAAFGGDADNVTIFGESAGAMAIADLMTSPLTKGLFRRAIVQSGHGAMVRDIGVAQKLVTKLAAKLRVTPDAEGFRTVGHDAAADAIDALAKPNAIDLRDADGFEPVFGISRFIPVYGDDVLPQKPIDALRQGAGSEIDLLIGTNADEMNLYFVPTGVRSKLPHLMAWWLLSRSLPDARKALKAYGLGQIGKRAGEAFTEATTDLVFRSPARQFAEAHQGNTWMYEMEWQSPACGGRLGACHGIEMPFVFDTLDTVTGPRGLAGEDPPHALARRVHKIWADFGRDGTLPWPRWNGEKLVYQLAAGKAITEPAMPAAAFLPD
ncbi:carboxylesterase/lipase family protein [Aurantiacibacter rhizosphaerae]|uniref:Carboxylic ester hydrolase n=1 Tax=Aurantiacibacter rhizosphaerae TaxID=2691582 RepID=A0A844XGT1_9SPHN|nr:carboxylesterase family protein [Aurantiacibacter rhizosphaerae]MWV28852.1 carboxylesterase family protein [Aurantiacibacter rhizosphaerae]